MSVNMLLFVPSFDVNCYHLVHSLLLYKLGTLFKLLLFTD